MENLTSKTKVEIVVLGLMDSGFAKLAKVIQQEDGSLYVTYKLMSAAGHHSRHADGTRAITLPGGKTLPLEKAKPLVETEFVQEVYQSGSLGSIERYYDMTDKIEKNDGLVCIDLRGCESFGLSIHYSAPNQLHHLERVLSFLKDSTDVYISTKTKPYTIVVVVKKPKKVPPNALAKTS